MGGIVTFTGMVPRHSRGALVDHLEYEAYGAMALREMTRLCDEIEAEIAGVRLAVEHRVGRLEIGDIGRGDRGWPRTAPRRSPRAAR